MFVQVSVPQIGNFVDLMLAPKMQSAHSIDIAVTVYRNTAMDAENHPAFFAPPCFSIHHPGRLCKEDGLPGRKACGPARS